ncbi:MAG: hypothetical protein K2O78_01465 [Muribaculaceae bacterium]|nr:hypothetical protein [Muribaculaceae bacterium]MDE7080312.1 hypothetical protein [Muribaculaceae bacterium]
MNTRIASILGVATLLLPLLTTGCGDDRDDDDRYDDDYRYDYPLTPGHLAGKWECKDADVLDLYSADYYNPIPDEEYDWLKDRVEDYLEDDEVYIHPSDIRISDHRIFFADSDEVWEVLGFDDDDLRVVYDTTVYIDSFAVGVKAEVKYRRDD